MSPHMWVSLLFHIYIYYLSLKFSGHGNWKNMGECKQTEMVVSQVVTKMLWCGYLNYLPQGHSFSGSIKLLEGVYEQGFRELESMAT